MREESARNSIDDSKSFLEGHCPQEKTEKKSRNFNKTKTFPMDELDWSILWCQFAALEIAMTFPAKGCSLFKCLQFRNFGFYYDGPNWVQRKVKWLEGTILKKYIRVYSWWWR